MENSKSVLNEFNEKSFSMPMVALRGLVIFPEMTLHFDVAQRAVTPGQSAVIYLGEECLGGGVIDEVTGVGEV